MSEIEAAGEGEAGTETIAGRLVAALREDIVKLRLRPGDAISESDVAERFGISRQPAREAFIRLAQQGLLKIRPKRATVVKKISADGVRQSRFIRESIEVEIIRRLARGGSRAIEARLNGLIAEQEEAPDMARFHAADELFHRMLARLAGVEYAWQLIEDHKIQLDRVRYLTLGVASQQRAVAEHKRIAETVGEGDEAAAEAAMRAHLARAEVLLRQTIAEFPEYFSGEDDDDSAGD